MMKHNNQFYISNVTQQYKDFAAMTNCSKQPLKII